MFSKPVVITFATKDIEEYSDITKEINRKYCAKNGYKFVSESERVLDDSYDPHWEKVAMINRYLNKPRTSWVFFIDADAAFNHDDVKIDDFFRMAPKSADVIICHDGNNKDPKKVDRSESEEKHYVNTGAILVRNTGWARDFMKSWINNAGKFKKGSELQDQDKFVDMLKNDEKGAFSGKKVAVMPINMFNSSYERPYADTFVVHMMRRKTDERVKRFKEILDKKPAKNPDEVVLRAYYSRPNYDSKIAIVTMYDDPIASYSRFSTAITQMYGARHRYETIVIRERLSDRDPQWDKVYAVAKVLDQKQHDYVMWIDSDATFQDQSITLESIIDKEMTGGTELLICDDTPNKGMKPKDGDIYPNTGTFIFKNGDWARQFSDTWWKNPMNKERARYHEQDVLMELHNTGTNDLKNKMKVLGCEVMNSKFSGLPSKKYLKGGNRDSFVIHMMARNREDRRKVFEQMLNKEITKGDFHKSYVPDRLPGELKSKGGSSSSLESSSTYTVLGAVLVLLALAILAFVFRKYQLSNSQKRD